MNTHHHATEYESVLSVIYCARCASWYVRVEDWDWASSSDTASVKPSTRMQSFNYADELAEHPGRWFENFLMMIQELEEDRVDTRLFP